MKKRAVELPGTDQAVIANLFRGVCAVYGSEKLYLLSEAERMIELLLFSWSRNRTRMRIWNINCIGIIINKGEFTPIEVSREIGVTNKTVINRLSVLVKNGFVEPLMVNQRIRSYELSDFTRDNEKTIKKMI